MVGLENHLTVLRGNKMKKIISLFARNYNGDYKVRNEVVAGAEWVVNGEGQATVKHDGVAVLIRSGVAFTRYDNKPGRTAPTGFFPAQDPDPVTGRVPGWVPTDGTQSKYIREAVENAVAKYPEGIPDGTYEACGPKIGTRHGSNPEGLTEHTLFAHGSEVLDCPRTFDELMVYLKDRPIEGIVWHHVDGRMVKVKKSDFPY
jgi:hypothetical protein